MSQSIEEQFKAMPPITRGWFVAALLTTTAVVLGFAQPAKLYLNWDLVINKFEIWRLVTNFIFFGPFGMGFAFQLWIMCRMCYRYEENPFPVGTHINAGRSSADMMMMLMFGAIICVIIGYLMGKPFMGPPLVFMVLYVWSRRNENAEMSIFGIRIVGYQYPWAMLALSVLMGSDPVPDLIGIFAGHVFYFIIDVGPNRYAESWPKWLLLQTPNFLFDAFDERRVNPGGTSANQRAPVPTAWGNGRALGGAGN